MSVHHSNHRCVGKPPAATADERQRTRNPVMLDQVARHPQSEPDESYPVRPTFREDFLLEHSRFGRHTDSIEFLHYF